MMSSNENPWVERLTPLLNRDEILRRAELRPVPIKGIDQMTPSAASVAIEAALGDIFYPSAQCLDILAEWITLASAHCTKLYTSRRSFLEGVYQPRAPLPEFSFPFCLTGLAGTGKSALHKAVGRIMPLRDTVTTEDGTVFPLESCRTITVRTCGTPRDIMVMLAQREGGTRALLETLRKQAYRDGWAFLCLDEFQFATQSEKANTRVVQMLMAVCYIGIPAAFIANYSLIHKLKARNQEDIHRFLGNVRLLRPEPQDSADWRTLLRWQKEVAPEVFDFDPDADAEAIHQLSAGINRAISRLLKIAFVHACATGHTVRLAELERAYKADDYSVFRTDIATLQKINTERRTTNKDMWLPLDISANNSIQDEWHRQRQERVNEAALTASLTAEERSSLEELKRGTQLQSKPRKARVIPIANEKSTADQLKDNLTWYQDKL